MWKIECLIPRVCDKYMLFLYSITYSKWQFLFKISLVFQAFCLGSNNHGIVVEREHVPSIYHHILAMDSVLLEDFLCTHPNCHFLVIAFSLILFPKSSIVSKILWFFFFSWISLTVYWNRFSIFFSFSLLYFV